MPFRPSGRLAALLAAAAAALTGAETAAAAGWGAEREGAAGSARAAAAADARGDGAGSARRADGPAGAARTAAASATAVPHALPPAGARAAAARGGWLVGGRPSAAAARLAARFGATPAGDWGAYVVDARRARAFAAALRTAGAYRFAEPDRRATIAASSDPLTAQAGWRDAVVRPDLAPPGVTAATPLVALIDSQLDATHPEFAGSNVTTTAGGVVDDEHGTATAGVASAPVNGQGIEGIWPNARTVNIPTTLSCGDIVDRIADALRLGARVLNMSYGSASFCFAEYVALQVATARGVLLVAAAGNEFAEGNPLEYPASLPHVFTIAAASSRTQAAYFSNANAAIDLTAPGAGILTTVPPALDPDGDGYGLVSGTSFAAPIVAGAAGWLRAARPELDAYQLQQVLRITADDMDRPGWDVRTGWGFIDLAGALVQAPPRRDPLEPNDAIPFVDGTAFGTRARPVFGTRSRSRRLDAAIDVFEDPHDVYRIVVPARRSVRVSVRPRFGNPDLKVFGRSATDVSSSRHLVARSRRGRGRTDSVVVRNRSRSSRSYFVDVNLAERGSTLNAAYRLTVTRR